MIAAAVPKRSDSPGAAARAANVAIIGGGAAGLAACREVIREGLTCTVFEQASFIGIVYAS